MGSILVGTCSWADPSLIKAGTFYPATANDAEGRLRYYSEHFPVVEVDSSYYAIPTETVSSLWAQRTPAGFTFDVKAFSLFTNHPTAPRSFPRDLAEVIGTASKNERVYYNQVPQEVRNESWKRFKAALEPLARAGKLGPILLQFPPWFTPSARSTDHILECIEYLKPLRCSVEFRHSGWLTPARREDTLRFLRQNDLIFVCVDEPQGFVSSIPPVAESTAKIGIVRFHGRNTATWMKKGLKTSERFDWYYAPEELKDWLPRVQALAENTEELHLLFNTNNGDQGIVNARGLQELVLQAGLAQPHWPPSD